MSRTKRYIQPYYRRISPQVLTWVGLGELYHLEQDPRCALSNGRDHCRQSKRLGCLKLTGKLGRNCSGLTMGCKTCKIVAGKQTSLPRTN